MTRKPMTRKQLALWLYADIEANDPRINSQSPVVKMTNLMRTHNIGLNMMKLLTGYNEGMEQFIIDIENGTLSDERKCAIAHLLRDQAVNIWGS